jgi:CO/xanthine dehydrogenase Mo-binding subunit
MVGNAVLMACRELKAKIVASVARSAEVDASRVRLADGWAFTNAGAGNGTDGRPPDAHRMPIAAAFMLAEAEHRTLGAVGHHNPPTEGAHGDYRGGTIGASPAYSFTAHVAEVEVDEDTGFVDVKKIWVAHDCGKALNPMLVEGQIEGSAYMGFAEALMEEQIVKRGTPEGGLHNAPSLLDYRIPTSLDCPEFIAMIVEANDPEGPYGAKEAGEGPVHPSLPAIANAIYDAVGVRIDRLPFTPDRVWRSLQEAREQGAAAKAG